MSTSISFKLAEDDERDQILAEVIERLKGERYNVSGVIKDALESHFKTKGWWPQPPPTQGEFPIKYRKP